MSIPSKEESIEKLLKIGISQEEINENIGWRKKDLVTGMSKWSKGLIKDLIFDEDKMMALVLRYHENDHELDERTNIKISKSIWKDIKKIGFRDGNSLLIHTNAFGQIEAKYTSKVNGRFNSRIFEKSSQGADIKICGGDINVLDCDIKQIENWLKIGVLYPDMPGKTPDLNSSGKVYNDSTGNLALRSTIDDPIIPETELSQLYMLERLKEEKFDDK